MLFLKDYTGTVKAGATAAIPVSEMKSFQLRQLVSNVDGTDVEIPFKICRDGDIPSDYVLLKSGFGGFFPEQFNRVEIINRSEVDITYRFTVSPDIISDSRVFGSVNVTNTQVPVLNSFTGGLMDALYVADFRTQSAGIYPIISSTKGLAFTNAFRPLIFSYKGSVTLDATYTLSEPIITFSGDCYVRKISFVLPYLYKTDTNASSVCGLSIGATKAAAIELVPYSVFTPGSSYAITVLTDRNRYEMDLNCFMPAGTNIYLKINLASGSWDLSTVFATQPIFGCRISI